MRVIFIYFGRENKQRLIMKYILTGGSGFIGSHFLKKLGDSVILNYDIERPALNKTHKKKIFR